ncbi:MAG: RecX family transcriptional regulator [Candidatus Dojkabacteria bacterium]
MIVSKLEYQKRDPKRVNLYIDSRFYCGISIDTLAKESLFEGLELDEEVLDRILWEELLLRFWNRSLEYISKSLKSEFQVRKYLKELRFKKRKLWYKEDVELDWEKLYENIIKKLKKYGYINDENFARAFVQSRIRVRPRGVKVLVGELLSKGIDKEIAQMVCNEEVGDEYELLKKTIEKKYRGKKFDIEDSKMVNFLLRKGFSWDLIQQFSSDDD